MTQQPTSGPQMMYVCEICAEHASESCGYHDADMIRLSPSGKWLCEYCYDDEAQEEGAASPLWSDLRKAPAFAFASVAARDVIDERRRQISVEGWTPQHDDAHDKGEMAGAAACYVMQAVVDDIGRRDLQTTILRTIRELWPWSAHWWKPTSRRRDLVKAAALIIAEIERLDRAARQTDDQKSAPDREGGARLVIIETEHSDRGAPA